MSNRILLHGVPNTPRIWDPVVGALGEAVATPCLPGFGTDLPAGFRSTKDDYAQWLVGLIEAQHAAHGPVDLVGHDWGALLTLRAASLRPDLIRSWAITAAALDQDYRGHLIAHLWNTPLAGEFFMALVSPGMMERSFRQSGLPSALAAHEASAWRKTMRQSILALYRSANALRFAGDWIDRLDKLPPHGLVIWGTRDPYVSLAVGRRFAEMHRARLHVEEGAGHWAIVERPRTVAWALQAHWAGAIQASTSIATE
jgi:pimeloyl-ACP methyl ester carboxylesterase